MQQFQKVKAYFKPIKIGNLSPSAKRFIGSFCEWKALWIIEEGPYKGQWAMSPNLKIISSARLDFCWVPEGDLEIVENIGV